MYKIKDFKVGQLVGVELTGNASRNKQGDELIEEWIITTIGRKYITATPKNNHYRDYQFEEHECSYAGLIQRTGGYSVDYVLYPSVQEAQEKKRKEQRITTLKQLVDRLKPGDITLV